MPYTARSCSITGPLIYHIFNRGNAKNNIMPTVKRKEIVKNKLKIIPYYTGKETLGEALEDNKSSSLLWLEILFNDDIYWKGIKYPRVREAYVKACVWYHNFKSLIDSCIKRQPLELMKGKIDSAQTRRFQEALNFVRN